VPFIRKSLLLPCVAEWLAGAASRPDRFIVAPSGIAQGTGPNSHAGEEMALRILLKLEGFYFAKIALVHNPVRDMPRRNKIAEKLRRVGIVFVIVGGHRSKAMNSF